MLPCFKNHKKPFTSKDFNEYLLDQAKERRKEVSVCDIKVTNNHIRELINHYLMYYVKIFQNKTYPPEITILINILDKYKMLTDTVYISEEDKAILISIIKLNHETRKSGEFRLRDVVIDKLSDIMQLDKINIIGYENLEEIHD